MGHDGRGAPSHLLLTWTCGILYFFISEELFLTTHLLLVGRGLFSFLHQQLVHSCSSFFVSPPSLSTLLLPVINNSNCLLKTDTPYK